MNVAKTLEKTRNYLLKRLIKIVDFCKGKGNRNDSVSSVKIIEAENAKTMDSSNDLTRLLRGPSKSLLMDKEGSSERKNEDEGGATRAARTKEETRNARKRRRKRLTTERNLDVKTVESEETMVDPSLEEKFLVSILEESGVLRASSKELLSIQMNVLRKSHPSKDRISEKEHEDDENLTNTADSREKIPVPADSHREEEKEKEEKEEKKEKKEKTEKKEKKETKEKERKEKKEEEKNEIKKEEEKNEIKKEESKEEKAEVVEVEANRTDATRSSKNDMECEDDRKEKEETVGPSPDVDTLKNSNPTESTIFLSRS